MSNFWKHIRQEFSLAPDILYFDTAAAGPIPIRVQEAVRQYYREQAEEGDFAWLRWMDRKEEARQRMAAWIGAEPEELAWTTSTSHGMNLVADLLAARGDVLMPAREFPSSSLPWIWRGTKIRWMESDSGRYPVSEVKNHLDESVATIVSSYVQYATGFRQNLEALGEMKGERPLVINSSQALGAFPIDVKKQNIDFLVANSYKWLLAGYGGGTLYIRKKWLEASKPDWLGWRSVADPDKMDNRCSEAAPSAGRYELGGPSFPTIFAMGEAVKFLSEIGKDKIAARVLELSGYAAEILKREGFEILSPSSENERSGIVIIKMDNAKAVWKRLLQARVATSPRGGGIRLALHFFNQEEEIERMIPILKQAIRGS